MNRIDRVSVLLLMSFSSASGFAADSEHEQERVKDAGEVLKKLSIFPTTSHKTCSTKQNVWLSCLP